MWVYIFPEKHDGFHGENSSWLGKILIILLKFSSYAPFSPLLVRTYSSYYLTSVLILVQWYVWPRRFWVLSKQQQQQQWWWWWWWWCGRRRRQSFSRYCYVYALLSKTMCNINNSNNNNRGIVWYVYVVCARQ